jgi:DNA repair photolyase
MSITITFDQIDRNRVFIDTNQICTGACLYCYVADFETSTLPGRKEFVSAEFATQALTNEASFVMGIHGTAISMGCYADPLHPNSIATTKKILPYILALENPIQMASKCFDGSIGLAHQLAAQQQYSGQFTLLVTITSFAYASELEPGTPAPYERLKVLADYQQAGINTALFIKPMLPGITEYEVDAFAEAIRKFEIPNCVIGLFYANQRILNKFKSKKLPIKIDNSGEHYFPNDTHHVLNQTSSNKLRDEFYLNLKERVGIPVFKTSMCTVAHRLKIPDPMRTWRRYPDLCVNCQDCEKLVVALSSDLWERYD